MIPYKNGNKVCPFISISFLTNLMHIQICNLNDVFFPLCLPLLWNDLIYGTTLIRYRYNINIWDGSYPESNTEITFLHNTRHISLKPILEHVHIRCMYHIYLNHTCCAQTLKYVLGIIVSLLYNKGPSWSWSYDSWIYNYQCVSLLKLWVRILLMLRCTWYNITL